MSGQHTPGPWKAVYGTTFTRVYTDPMAMPPEVRKSVGTVQICHISGPEDSELRPFNAARWASDAHLIAAAPELLELACQYLSDLRRPPTGDSLERRIDRAKAVIAKATGAA